MKKTEFELIVKALKFGENKVKAYEDNFNQSYFTEKRLWPNLDKNNLDFFKNESKDVDIFYSKLTLFLTTEYENFKLLSKKMNDRANISNIMDFIQDKLYQRSDFDIALEKNIASLSKLPDVEIKKNLQNAFSIKKDQIMSLPTNSSVFYLKMNHGFWEFMGYAYSEEDRGERFRSFNDDVKRRVKYNSHTQLWAQLVLNYFTESNEGIVTKVDFGLSNGTMTFEQVIRNELNIYGRGAGVSILSLLESINGLGSPLEIGDGTAARALMKDRKMSEFRNKYIDDTEACLFIVPSHLKDIEVSNYSGSIYKIIVPDSKIHATWKVLATLVIGYINEITKTHKSLVIFSQGSSISPLITLLSSKVSGETNALIRMFDMGQLLDAAAAGKMRNYQWLDSLSDEDIAEVKKVFVLGGGSDFSILTPF